MVKLTNEEEHWLREFAKENELFESMLTSYEVNRYLTGKQRHRIREEINKEENDGDIILPEDELMFLKEIVDKDGDLEKLLEMYELTFLKEIVDKDNDLEKLLEIYEIYGCFAQSEYHKLYVYRKLYEHRKENKRTSD